MKEPGSLISAVILSLVFVFGGLVHAERFRHRRRWISIAAGASVAYVFVHLLPELSEQQAAFAVETQRGVFLAEVQVYTAALVGFVLFYGLDTMAFFTRTDEHEAEQTHQCGNLVPWLHIIMMALYAATISYLLVDWTAGPRSLFFYTIAMAFHFLVYDHGLREEYGRTYGRQGRWVLFASVFIGWALGEAVVLAEQVVAIMVGFVAGSVTMNSMKDELPKSGEGRFVPFALGAAVFSIMLLL